MNILWDGVTWLVHDFAKINISLSPPQHTDTQMQIFSFISKMSNFQRHVLILYVSMNTVNHYESSRGVRNLLMCVRASVEASILIKVYMGAKCTLITFNLRRIRKSERRSAKITFEPVHAATTSWILHGVTTTIKPNDIAAIVRDTEPLSRLSCTFIFCMANIWNKETEEKHKEYVKSLNLIDISNLQSQI